jgi:hypothetical protein
MLAAGTAGPSRLEGASLVQTITALAMLGALALAGGCADFADEAFPPEEATASEPVRAERPPERAPSSNAAAADASDRALSRRAPSDEASPANEVRAWKGALEPNGWIAAAGSADGKTVTFRRPPEHKPDGTVVMWERYERRDHEPGQWRSLVAMSEYDCQAGRARTLQETTYTEPNLSGRAVTASTPGEWTYPIPGSMMEGSLKIACESSAAANRARAAGAAGAEAAAVTESPPKKPKTAAKKAKAAPATATPAAAMPAKAASAKATSAKATSAKAPAKKKKKPAPPPAEPAAKHIDIPLLPPT